MSSLMMALGTLGGLVLAGVVAHGAWSARQAGPKRAVDLQSGGTAPAELREPVMDEACGGSAGDTAPGVSSGFAETMVSGGSAGGGSAVDPEGSTATFARSAAADSATQDVAAVHSTADESASSNGAPAAAGPAPASSAGGGRIEPAAFFDSVQVASRNPPERRRGSPRLVARVDALIDAVASLRLEAPVGGQAVMPHLPATRRAGGKPFLIEGRQSDTGDWETPTGAGTYSEFQAGLQLANRTGALNEIEYSEFVQKVQAFAEAIGAMADFPDMLEAVAGARELDHFASEHDAQLAVHLRARQTAWSVGYVRQQAGLRGFVPGVVPGRLVMPAADEGSPPVLTLTFDSQAALADDPDRSAVRDLTLAFDVPQTDPRAAPFAAWQSSAEALASDMDALILDDHGRPLAAESFKGIDSQLDLVYAQLAARDIAAGSPAARRLFS